MAEIKKLTKKQRAVVERAIAYRNEKGLPDAKFAHELPFSASMWLRLRTDKYTGDVQGNIKLLEERLNELEAIDQNSRIYASEETEWYATAVHKAVFQCIRKGLRIRSQTQDRMVILSGPTGAGKSSTAYQAQAVFDGAYVVEGRPSWRKSGKEFCKDVCAALGEPSGAHTQGDCEKAMYTAVSRKCEVLIIDEANYFNNDTVNQLKFLMNKTQVVVLVCGITQSLEKMFTAQKDDAAQFRRRLLGWLVIEKMQAKDAQPLLGGLPLEGFERAACVAVAKAANKFGMFDTVKRIREQLQSQVEDGVQLNIEAVHQAIELTMLTLGFRDTKGVL